MTEAASGKNGRKTPGKAARFLFLWGPPLVYFAAVTALSLVPLGKTPAVWKFQDKVVHFAEYFILSALLFRAFRPSLGAVLAMAACIASSAALGAAIEVLQPLFGRGADFWDWAANSAGAIVAAFLTALVYGLLGGAGGGESR